MVVDGVEVVVEKEGGTCGEGRSEREGKKREKEKGEGEGRGEREKGEGEGDINSLLSLLQYPLDHIPRLTSFARIGVLHTQTT